MVRLFVSGWAALLAQRALGGANPARPGSPSHDAARRAALVRDQAFADSGFWDFALLRLYDHAMRRFVLGGITALSEFGWTERALLTSSRALDFAPSAAPLATLKNLGLVFGHLGQNLALGAAGCLAVSLAAEGAGLAALGSSGLSLLGAGREALSDLAGPR